METHQSITPKIVVDAFNFFAGWGGDPSTAIENAKKYSSIGEWVVWQSGYAATFGAIVTAIPIAHVPMIVADLAFLIHKMGYCSWGIGAMHGCPIDSKEDLSIILAMCAAGVEEDALEAAANTGFLALTVGGSIAIVGLPTFMGKTAGAGAKFGAKALGKALAKGAIKVGGKTIGSASVGSLISASAPIIGKFSTKIATKLSTKVTAKTIGNVIMGFAPIVGPIVAGGVNVWFMFQIANAADIYYTVKKKALEKIHKKS